MLLNTIDYVCR